MSKSNEEKAAMRVLGEFLRREMSDEELGEYSRRIGDMKDQWEEKLRIARKVKRDLA